MSLNYTTGDGERETLKVAEDRLDLQWSSIPLGCCHSTTALSLIFFSCHLNNRKV